MAQARYRDARFSTEGKNDAKHLTVILAMMRHVAVQLRQSMRRGPHATFVRNICIKDMERVKDVAARDWTMIKRAIAKPVSLTMVVGPAESTVQQLW